MGYEIHITRRANWWDAEGPSIGAEEWSQLVASDPELRAHEAGSALWMGHPQWREQGVPLYPGSAGDILTKTPDRAICVKLHELAERLGAKVQGDDGETYDADGRATPPEVPRKSGAGEKYEPIEVDAAIVGRLERKWRYWQNFGAYFAIVVMVVVVLSALFYVIVARLLF